MAYNYEYEDKKWRIWKEAYKNGPDIYMERSKDNYHIIAPPGYTYKKAADRMAAEAGWCNERSIPLIV